MSKNTQLNLEMNEENEESNKKETIVFNSEDYKIEHHLSVDEIKESEEKKRREELLTMYIDYFISVLINNIGLSNGKILSLKDCQNAFSKFDIYSFLEFSNILSEGAAPFSNISSSSLEG
jgi:hypothetical protein